MRHAVLPLILWTTLSGAGGSLFGCAGDGEVALGADLGPVDAAVDAADPEEGGAAPGSDGGRADGAGTEMGGADGAGPVVSAGPIPAFEPLSPRPASPSCVVDPDDPPALLSQTGCYVGTEPAAEIVPYAVRSPLWTDGAFKTRFIALPAGATVGATVAGEWEWPDGAVILKTFTLEHVAGDASSRRHAETRVMVKVPGDWRFFTYRWRDDLSDADRLDADLEVTFELHDDDGPYPLRYYFPEEDGCQHCHEGVALGPRTEQLNMQVRYGGEVADQLDAMAAAGLFSAPLPAPADRPQLADPYDVTLSLEARARSYLHGNCGHCHRPGGWQPPELTLDLRAHTPLQDAHLCGVPYQYNLAPGTGDLRLDPGHPENSMVLGRMLAEDLRRMPSIGTFAVDERGTDVVRAWIQSLSECPQ